MLLMKKKEILCELIGAEGCTQLSFGRLPTRVDSNLSKAVGELEETEQARSLVFSGIGSAKLTRGTLVGTTR